MAVPTYCCDANVALRLHDPPSTEQESVAALWERWEAERAVILAPALLGFEVTNGLYRGLDRGEITALRALEVLRSVSGLPITYIHATYDMHAEAVRLAQFFGMRAAYDAHYLALAQREGIELYTLDRKLYNSVRHHLTFVRYVMDDPQR